MKSLFKKIFRFILPLGVLLYLLPTTNRLKYSGLKNDCMNQGEWIYNRVYNQDEPIDIVFFGSSHTLNGISDTYLSKKLAPLTATNFGYCRLGRNLHYSLLKMVKNKKNPKHVILEIRENEDRYSHPIFPLISDSKDVLAPTMILHWDFFSDLWVHTLYKLELIQDYLYETPQPYERDNIYAFGPVLDTISPLKLKHAKIYEQNKNKDLSQLEKDIHYRFPEEYIKRIKAICSKADIKLSFVYIPKYGVSYKPAELQAYYGKYGKVYLPSQAIYNNVDYWADEDHLNRAGGLALSEWMAKELLKSK